MSVRLSVVILCLLSLNAARAEEPPTTANVEITGHIVRPEKLDPAKSEAAGLKVPTGFQIKKFAGGLINPRILAIGPDGTVYATRRSVGDVILLKDTDGDGLADVVRTVASRPNMHGIAIDGRKAYLVTIKEIYATDIASDGSFGTLTRIVDDLPDAGQHADRTIAVGSDGMLYVSVGSTCNVCIEDNPESATMLQVKPDGSSRRIIASGLRNTIGFAFQPSTGELYGWDHGIDWLGDNAQPEEMNLIKEGHKYGWPLSMGWGEKNVQHDPPGSITHEEWAQSSDNPVLTHTADAAPMQFAFYSGDQFPAEYRGDAFIAFHGSWNRNPPSGYEVLRVHFEDGKPKSLQPFVTGFLLNSGGEKYGYMGRPFGIAVGKDGSLFIGDDANGAIYRITYEGKQTAVPATKGSDLPPMHSAPAGQDTPEELAGSIVGGKAGDMQLTSPAFSDGANMDIRYSAYGQNISPELTWSRGPATTKSYALLVEDPDAQTPKPVVHWILYNLPAEVTHLREGLPGAPALADPKDAHQGRNTRGTTGYTGPRPPDPPPHHYHFQLFALDTKLSLRPGAGRREILDAMQSHVLSRGELVGVFQKPAQGAP